MVIGLVLWAWALLVAYAFPIAMSRASWPSRAPRLAVLVWQSASLSFLAAVVVGALALAVPGAGLVAQIDHLAEQCVTVYRQATETPAGMAVCFSGLALGVAVLGRVVWCVGGGLRRNGRRRRAHAEGLRMVARHDRSLGVLVVDHPVRHAYCLPGRGGAIVVTSAALEGLRPVELAAVLAHERAHASARHHLVVALSTGLHASCPPVAVFRCAAQAVPVLVEMAADDVAGRAVGRSRVAAALAAFVEAPTAPAAALAVSGPGALGRIERLMGPARPLGFVGVSGGLGLALVVLALPVLVAVSPA
ncbi:MAG: M56 family metallopeptidase [Sporichthyaceae bacterium]